MLEAQPRCKRARRVCSSATASCCTRQNFYRIAIQLCIVLAVGVVLLVWGIDRSIWGPTGSMGVGSSRLYGDNSVLRGWARRVSSLNGQTLMHTWDWLPFCWPVSKEGEPPTEETLAPR